MTCKKIICDTDFLISLFVKNESTSLSARELYQEIKEYELYSLELVHFELATVLSRKFKHSDALEILQLFSEIPIQKIILTEEEKSLVWEDFFSYSKKNISFIDCANLVMAKKIQAKIASFDKFYPKKYLA